MKPEPIAIELWQDRILRATCRNDAEAFATLLKLQGQSTHYALRWGGWKYRPVYEGPLYEHK